MIHVPKHSVFTKKGTCKMGLKVPDKFEDNMIVMGTLW